MTSLMFVALLGAHAGQTYEFIDNAAHVDVAVSDGGERWSVASAKIGVGLQNRGVRIHHDVGGDWEESGRFAIAGATATIAVDPLTDLPGVLLNDGQRYMLCEYDPLLEWGVPCEDLASPSAATPAPDDDTGRLIPRLLYLSDGRAMVVYYNGADNTISAFIREPTGWSSATVSAPVSGDTVVAFDAVSHGTGASVAWIDTASVYGEGAAFYSSSVGNVWSPAEMVDTTRAVGDLSVDVDSNGDPHLVYIDSRRYLVHSVRGAGTWNPTSAVHRVRNGPARVDMELDQLDQPHLLLASQRDPYGDCMTPGAASIADYGYEIEYGAMIGGVWRREWMWGGGAAPSVSLAMSDLDDVPVYGYTMQFARNDGYAGEVYDSGVRATVEVLSPAVFGGGTVDFLVRIHNNTRTTVQLYGFADMLGSCSGTPRAWRGFDMPNTTVPAFSAQAVQVSRPVPVGVPVGTYVHTWYLDDDATGDNLVIAGGYVEVVP